MPSRGRRRKADARLSRPRHFATIYLNGTEIGQSSNMFIGKEIDVTDALVAGANIFATC